MNEEQSHIIQAAPGRARELVRRLRRLVDIGTALSAERDLFVLLEMILREARGLTSADGGSIYIRETERVYKEKPTGADALYTETPFLVLKLAQNDSLEFPFKEFRLPFDAASVAGYVATTRRSLNAKDVYNLPADTPFHISKSFDEATGYVSRSMLVIPMVNVEGETCGVIQLINKKKDPLAKLRGRDEVERQVIPFDEIDEELVRSLASQAGICIEKARLYSAVEELFDGFVQSLAAALEKRNRTTYGHCMRVAAYAEAIARAIHESKEPPFADVRFTEDQLRELRYAALLHDIGKLAVREAILDKRNKLGDAEVEAIGYRLARAGRPLEDIEFIRRVNVPKPMNDEDVARVQALGKLTFADVDGSTKPLLTPLDVENLTIRYGNLTGAERREIEEHIVNTWEILRRIDWPKDLRRVPHLAATHHEKLDGKGYPWGFTAPHLDVMQRILPIVDIFEALTAKDRPYKPPMPVPKALEILDKDVAAGKLDGDIVRLFKEKDLYRLFSDETGRIRPKEEK